MPDPAPFALPAMLDLLAAEGLQREMLARFRANEDVTADGSAVARVSTACVQILLAAAAEAESRGRSFQLRAPSLALSLALADLGVTALLPA